MIPANYLIMRDIKWIARIILIVFGLIHYRELPAHPGPPDSRPNFIFIFADDLGWGDLGCYGNPDIQTPRLDEMASEGLLVTNFYVCSPVCSPSRTAVMTGHFPARHGIHQHLTRDHEFNLERGMPDWLDPSVTLLTRLMQQNGYKTAHFGKWHLGNTMDAPSPGQYGIDVHYTNCNSDKKLVCPRHESDEVIVNQTIDFIEQHRNEPFYINVWTLIPHATLDPTKEQLAVYDRYAAREPAKSLGFSTPQQVYYSCVTDLDLHIGRLLERLEDLGLSEKTIVVFSSDNGPEDIYFARHSGYGSPGPFRGRKRSLYEGGIRVPFIVQWKGHISPGFIDDQSVIGAVDLLPTFCSLAGIDLPDGYRPDGEDVSEIFTGNTHERSSPLLWEWRGDIFGYTFNRSPMLALRWGKWKFLMNPDKSRIELYDFGTDPLNTEMDNVADRNPEIVERFSDTLLEFSNSLPRGGLSESAGRMDYPMPERITH